MRLLTEHADNAFGTLNRCRPARKRGAARLLLSAAVIPLVAATPAMAQVVVDGGAHEIVDGAGGGTQVSPWAIPGSPDDLTLGQSGTGTLTLRNGGAVSGRDGVLGDLAGSTGTATISGTGTTWTNTRNLLLGVRGTGTLRVEDGAVVTNAASAVGNLASGVGTATITGAGSQWNNTSGLGVGTLGSGTLRIEDGGQVFSAESELGARGTATVTGVDSRWTTGNVAADGFLRVENGGTVNGGRMTAEGEITVTGVDSTLTLTSQLVVDDNGRADLTVSAGGAVSARDFVLGDILGRSGTLTITGAGSNMSTLSGNYVGRGGAGTLRIEDGGTLSSGSGGGGASVVGDDIGSNGTVIVDGIGSAWTKTGHLVVGGEGSGTVSISGGATLNTMRKTTIGVDTNTTAQVTVTGAGSRWESGDSITISTSKNGTLTLSDAAVVNVKNGTGDVIIGPLNNANGTLNIGAAAGDTAVGAGTLNAATIEFNQFNTLTGKVIFNHTDTGYNFDPVMTGTGSVEAYSGTTTLTAANTYTGPTNVHGGTLEVTGSLTNAGDITVGTTNTGSAGTFQLTNGGTVDGTRFVLGRDAGSTGNAVVSGTGSSWTNSGNVTIGDAGTGSLRIEAGGAVSNAVGIVGSQAGSQGSVTVTGANSSWTNSGDVAIGVYGTGNLRIEAGGDVSSAGGTVGAQAGGDGSVTVTGAGSKWTMTSNFLTVGNVGTGSVRVEDGGSVNLGKQDAEIGVANTGSVTVTGVGSSFSLDSGDIKVGNGAAGNMTVEDAGEVRATNLTVGYDSTGTVTIRGGGKLNATAATLGIGFQGVGTVTVTGAGSELGGKELTIGKTGTGTVTISNGGALGQSAYQPRIKIAESTGSTGTLNIGAAAGDTPVTAGIVTFVDLIQFGDGTGKLVFNHTDANYEFFKGISGAGAVEVHAGTTRLTNTHTYTGPTTVSGGTLLVDGTITSGATLSGGTLGGSGTAGAVTATGGTIAPGNSIGTLNTGDLSTAGTLEIEVDGTGASDTLNVTGSVDITDATLDLKALGDISALPFQTAHTIVENDAVDAVTGSFGAGTGLNTAGDLFSIVNTSGGDGNDVTLDVVLARLSLADGATEARSTMFPDTFPRFDFTVEGSDTATFSGSFSESATPVGLTKSGSGTLITTGTSTTTGAFTVNGGTLRNTGTLAAPITVNTGGRFGGTGTSGALTVNAGGFVAPGNSIGTLRVNGDVSLAAGATHEVELDDAGNADLIAATGRAVINNAALSVLPDTTGSYTGPSPTYTIITADGGVSGQYASVSDTLPDVDFEVTYGANDVTLSYVDAATTTSSGGTSPKDIHPASVMGAAGASLGFSTSVFKGGFASSGGGNGQVGRLQFDALGAPLSVSSKGAVAQRDWTVWGTGFGQRLSVAAQGALPAWQATTGGSALGLDVGIDAHGPMIATLAAGVTHTQVTSGLSRAAITGTLMGAGLAWQSGPLSMSAGLSYGRQSYTTTRVIPVGASVATAQGKTQGETVTASLAAYHEMPSSSESFRWGPTARLDWTQSRYDGFAETGAGVLNLNVAGARSTQAIVTVGLAGARRLTSRHGDITLNGALAWEHTAGNRSATSNAKLISTGGAFSVASAAVDANRLIVSLGADIELGPRSSAFVSYDARMGARSTEHSASFGLAITF